MAKFRAIANGYYGDVLRKPGGPHAVFTAPDDWCQKEGDEGETYFKCSWAEPVDDDAKVEAAEPERQEPIVLSDVKAQDDGTMAVTDEDGAVEIL